MNSKLFKKVLAAVLATTLLAMPIVAGATDQPEPESIYVPEPANDFPQVDAVTTPIVIGGSVVKNDVPGAVFIPKASAFSGFVPKQTKADLSASLGLEKGEAPWMVGYVLDPKKSKLAYDCFNAAAAAAGGEVLGAMNIGLYKMVDGKRQSIGKDAKATTTVGVKNAKGRALGVCKASSGGATEMQKDLDENPDTVTFEVSEDEAAYAVVAYDN